MSEQKIPIPAMLYNAAVGGHVTNSQQIIDEDYNLEQKDVNKEVLGVPYNSTTPNGMGKIVLKKNDNFKQVVEAQTDGNTIFVIKYDFTLTGDVTVPANCILEFDGGSISGEFSIIGNQTYIKASPVQIFGQDVIISGAFNDNDVYPAWKNDVIFVEWFGAKGDGITDDTDAIQKALDMSLWRKSDITNIQLLGAYIVSQTLLVYPFTRLGGNDINEEAAPQIKASDNFNGDLIQLTHYITGPSRIKIHNLALIGKNYGIVKESGVLTAGIIISDVYGGGELKRVISFEESGDTTAVITKRIEISRISCNSSVEIPIFISTNSFAYCIHIHDCHFASTKVGGIYLKSCLGITTPNVIEYCSFDHCGIGYDLDLYNQYGIFGIYIESSAGITEVRNCYFESDCPLKKNDDPAQTKHGFVEAKTTITGSYGGFTYITNPDWTKTAEIVFNGHITSNNQNLTGKLIVRDSHFSVNYQSISVVNGCSLVFEDNELYIPGYVSYGINNTVGFPIQKAIVKILSTASSLFVLGRHINLKIKHDIDTYREIDTELYQCIREGCEYDLSYNTNYATENIYIPSIGRTYKLGYIETDTLFVGTNTSSVQVGTPSFPISIEQLRANILQRIQQGNIKDKLNIVLLDDISLSLINAGIQAEMPAGIEYHFVSYGNKKKLVFDKGIHMIFYNSKVTFENLIIIKDKVTGAICLHNSDIFVSCCDILKLQDNRAYGVFNFEKGNNKLSLIESALYITGDTYNGEVLGGTATASSRFVMQTEPYGGYNRVELTDFTNSHNVPYYSTPDTNSGTFADKPADEDVYMGYEYFCTSGASIDGGTTEKPNITIYYTGSGWVDTNGTSVVAKS